MALGFTQPLTEMSTRTTYGVKARPVCKADNLAAIFEPIVWKCTILEILQLYRPRRPVTDMLTFLLQMFSSSQCIGQL
jgi:hypothetical protein